METLKQKLYSIAIIIIALFASSVLNDVTFASIIIPLMAYVFFSKNVLL